MYIPYSLSHTSSSCLSFSLCHWNPYMISLDATHLLILHARSSHSYIHRSSSGQELRPFLLLLCPYASIVICRRTPRSSKISGTSRQDERPPCCPILKIGKAPGDPGPPASLEEGQYALMQTLTCVPWCVFWVLLFSKAFRESEGCMCLCESTWAFHRSRLTRRTVRKEEWICTQRTGVVLTCCSLAR